MRHGGKYLYIYDFSKSFIILMLTNITISLILPAEINAMVSWLPVPKLIENWVPLISPTKDPKNTTIYGKRLDPCGHMYTTTTMKR